LKLIPFKNLHPEKGIPYVRDHLRRLWKAGKFPKPVALGDGGRIAFREDEIDEWLASRPRREDGAMPALATAVPNQRRKSARDRILDRHVDEIGLSTLARNALAEDGIEYVGELVQRSEQDLLALRSFGRVSLMNVNEALAKLGLQLGKSVQGWERPT
jgi:hypothetical protein